MAQSRAILISHMFYNLKLELEPRHWAACVSNLVECTKAGSSDDQPELNLPHRHARWAHRRRQQIE